MNCLELVVLFLLYAVVGVFLVKSTDWRCWHSIHANFEWLPVKCAWKGSAYEVYQLWTI